MMAAMEPETQKRIEFFDPEELITFEQDDDLVIPQRTSSKKVEDDPEYIIIEEDDYYASQIDNVQILKRREDFRGVLALVYTTATFGIFLIGMIIAIVDGLNRDVSIVENLERILPLLSGIFLGTLGFVLGYYFRRGDQA